MTARQSRQNPLASPALLSLDRPHLFLVEGGDDQALLAMVADELGVDGCQIHDMGGKDTGWGDTLAAVREDPMFQLNNKSIGLIRDADTDPDRVSDSCRDAFRKAGFPVPSRSGEIASDGARRFGYLVMPNAGPGTLEDVVLGAADLARVKSAEQYLDALAAAGHEPPKGRQKAVVQAYLAGLPDSPRNVAVGLRQDAFHMGAESLQFIFEFVTKLTSA